MSYRVGDTLFNTQGLPGVIKDRHRESGEFIVSNYKEALNKVRSTGYVNGLSETDRKSFEDIIGAVRKIDEPEKRVEELSKQIEAMEAQPETNRLRHYLTAEVNHMRHASGLKPASYRVNEAKISSK